MKPKALFGTHVKNQRINAKLTVERVARLSGLKVEFIEDIERGAFLPERRFWIVLVDAIPGLQLQALRKCAEAWS